MLHHKVNLSTGSSEELVPLFIMYVLYDNDFRLSMKRISLRVCV